MHTYASSTCHAICNNKLDHSYKAVILNDNIKFIYFSFGKNKNKTVAWFFFSKATLNIMEKLNNSTTWKEIKYLEPDFSNYKKLINKLENILLLQ